jgi:hypothetical protein
MNITLQRVKSMHFVPLSRHRLITQSVMVTDDDYINWLIVFCF